MRISAKRERLNCIDLYNPKSRGVSPGNECREDRNRSRAREDFEDRDFSFPYPMYVFDHRRDRKQRMEVTGDPTDTISSDHLYKE